MAQTLNIIIPVYNEENTVIQQLKKIQSACINIKNYNVVVVDDGSTDGTGLLLSNHSNLYSEMIALTHNQGKGYAIITGLEKIKTGFVLIQDADLEYDPFDIPDLWKQVEDNSIDVLMTTRFSGARITRVHYFIHKLGNKLITFIFNLLNNTTFSDIYSGYILFEASKLDRSKLRFYGWGQQAELLTFLVKNSDRIYEAPISYYGRTYSEGKKIRFHSIFKVIIAIVYTRIRVSV